MTKVYIDVSQTLNKRKMACSIGSETNYTGGLKVQPESPTGGGAGRWERGDGERRSKGGTCQVSLEKKSSGRLARDLVQGLQRVGLKRAGRKKREKRQIGKEGEGGFLRWEGACEGFKKQGGGFQKGGMTAVRRRSTKEAISGTGRKTDPVLP